VLDPEDNHSNGISGPGDTTSPSATADFVDLLESYRSGNQQAANELMHIFYPELRRMAAAHLGKERPEHSWQPTALLNELYLELRKVRKLRPVNDDKDRAAFLGFASQLMKRLLIHHARPLSQRVERVSMDTEDDAVELPCDSSSEVEIILSRLEALDSKLRAVVELKVFGGLTEPEIAIKLDCAPRTVARYWQFARHWLRRQFGGTDSRE
jgi:RNA polymerase sigma factor (TIGR02999 family)